ncbi:MAG: hypothetical protein HY286_06045 [Planctomycetes bacterium]|nr:hypothetical protein [Planctomycetota bacterium]
MKAILAVAALAAALFARAPVAPTQSRAAEQNPIAVTNPLDSVSQFIFYAVLEGCYQDGLTTQAAESLVRLDAESGQPKNFIYACPICMPAFDALRVYKTRPKFMDLLRLSHFERTQLKLAFEVRNKIGTDLLNNYKSSGKPGAYSSMDKCPSCEAAGK